MTATDTYLEHNNVGELASLGHTARPTHRIAIVTCMDARIDLGRLLGLSPGEAHVLRNAGGVVTDDVIRSLAVSQSLLDTREIMLIKHTECGMISDDEQALKGAIEARIGADVSIALHSFPDPATETRRSMARLRESPLLVHRDGVRGFVLDVATGQLREVDPSGS